LYRAAYKGIPYLILAALAAGFLFGAPRISAISAVAQVDKAVVARERKPAFPLLAGYIGKTNSVISRGFTDSDFSFSGSYIWCEDNDRNWKLKFTSSGIFTPLKDIVVDVFIVGGGGGGRTGTWTQLALTSGVPYEVIVGAGGNVIGTGGTSSFIDETYSKTGGSPGKSGSYTWDEVAGGNGGSGGGNSGNYSGDVAKDGGAGGFNCSHGFKYTGAAGGASGQGTTTREFGEETGDLYAGGGGGGGGGVRNGAGAKGGTGIVIIRNAR
jgi:hypothetical protein